MGRKAKVYLKIKVFEVLFTGSWVDVTGRRFWTIQNDGKSNADKQYKHTVQACNAEMQC